jgi:lysophospholipid acyltransferase (LPLAT)-like uncharacterized protein
VDAASQAWDPVAIDDSFSRFGIDLYKPVSFPDDTVEDVLSHVS